MKRSFYRAYLHDEANLDGLMQADAMQLRHRLEDEEILTLSLYRLGAQLFLYYECQRCLSPQQLLPSLSPLLAAWPATEAGPRLWAEMMPVYLAANSQDAASWRAGYTPSQRRGMLLRLKPAMVASYVYWHYQLQEESRYVPNQYLAIALHENLLFYYDELPPVAAAYVGSLSTQCSPPDWDAVMEPHFDYWEDVDSIHKRKRPLECLFSL